MKEGINELWPTLVFKSKLSEEERLKILNSYLISDGIGEISEEIPLLKEIALNRLGEMLKSGYGLSTDDIEIHTKGWVVGNKVNSFKSVNMNTHNHPNAAFTAIFYVLNRSVGGELVLYDARSNANRGFIPSFDEHFENLVHQPSQGDILIVPGFLYHSVHGASDEGRLSIPLDFFIGEK